MTSYLAPLWMVYLSNASAAIVFIFAKMILMVNGNVIVNKIAKKFLRRCLF